MSGEVPASAGPAPQVHVSANRLVDSAGRALVLHGVDRSGGEYACVQGWGFWDGPMNQASIDAMKTRKINAVRVPLNEACWNGLSYVSTTYRGTNYQNAVKAFVSLLNDNGLVAILDLHVSDGAWTGAAGGCTDPKATCLKPMPDAAQAIPFWQSVAATFKGNNAVVFDLFNEPFPEQAAGSTTTSAWTCLRNGGTCPGISYQTAGTQTLVNTIRATGATNVIMVPGLQWTNDLTRWVTYRPTDPQNNLAASFHTYGQGCLQSCWDQTLAPLLASYPLIAGEIGEYDCAHTYIDQLMAWMDNHGASYLGWTWDAWPNMCASGPTLISDYSGTPTAFGIGLRDHLRALALVPPGGTPIYGTRGADIIRGTPGNDVIYGLGGNDKIFGNSGDDLLVGGKGNDKLVGGDGNDTLKGKVGADRCKGGPGTDVAKTCERVRTVP
jgi:hypothetical protein